MWCRPNLHSFLTKIEIYKGLDTADCTKPNLCNSEGIFIDFQEQVGQVRESAAELDIVSFYVVVVWIWWRSYSEPTRSDSLAGWR